MKHQKGPVMRRAFSWSWCTHRSVFSKTSIWGNPHNADPERFTVIPQIHEISDSFQHHLYKHMRPVTVLSIRAKYILYWNIAKNQCKVFRPEIWMCVSVSFVVHVYVRDCLFGYVPCWEFYTYPWWLQRPELFTNHHLTSTLLQNVPWIPFDNIHNV